MAIFDHDGEGAIVAVRRVGEGVVPQRFHGDGTQLLYLQNCSHIHLLAPRHGSDLGVPVLAVRVDPLLRLVALFVVVLDESDAVGVRLNVAVDEGTVRKAEKGKQLVYDVEGFVAEIFVSDEMHAAWIPEIRAFE